MLWKHRVVFAELNLGSGKAFREVTFKLKVMKEVSRESEGEGPGRGSRMRNGLEVRKIPVVSLCHLPSRHHHAPGWEEEGAGFSSSLGELAKNPVWGLTHLS